MDVSRGMPPLRRLTAHAAVLKTGVAEVPEMDEQNRKISEQLVRLVQILFGVVAGQSLLLYRRTITSPFHHATVAAALALALIYLMIVWSWIDWNCPYSALICRNVGAGIGLAVDRPPAAGTATTKAEIATASFKDDPRPSSL